MGDVKQLGWEAVSDLSAHYSVHTRSHWYRSKAWGFEGPDFLNQVVEIGGVDNPQELLLACLETEKKLGRRREGQGYSNRPIDIDILFIGDQIIQTESLTIPHPRIHERNFTLIPLMEKWSSWIHPGFKVDIATLLARSQDGESVKREDGE